MGCSYPGGSAACGRRVCPQAARGRPPTHICGRSRLSPPIPHRSLPPAHVCGGRQRWVGQRARQHVLVPGSRKIRRREILPPSTTRVQCTWLQPPSCIAYARPCHLDAGWQHALLAWQSTDVAARRPPQRRRGGGEPPPAVACTRALIYRGRACAEKPSFSRRKICGEQSGSAEGRRAQSATCAGRQDARARQRQFMPGKAVEARLCGIFSAQVEAAGTRAQSAQGRSRPPAPAFQRLGCVWQGRWRADGGPGRARDAERA